MAALAAGEPAILTSLMYATGEATAAPASACWSTAVSWRRSAAQVVAVLRPTLDGGSALRRAPTARSHAALPYALLTTGRSTGGVRFDVQCTAVASFHRRDHGRPADSVEGVPHVQHENCQALHECGGEGVHNDLGGAIGDGPDLQRIKRPRPIRGPAGSRIRSADPCNAVPRLADRDRPDACTSPARLV